VSEGWPLTEFQVAVARSFAMPSRLRRERNRVVSAQLDHWSVPDGADRTA
jgi:hypothetical protein